MRAFGAKQRSTKRLWLVLCSVSVRVSLSKRTLERARGPFYYDTLPLPGLGTFAVQSLFTAQYVATRFDLFLVPLLPFSPLPFGAKRDCHG